MKVLMFGWELPPFFAGGVGTVCDELTKELSKRGDVSVTYVMPFGPSEIKNKKFRVIIAENIKDRDMRLLTIPSLMGAYMTEEDYMEKFMSELEGKTSIGKNNTKRLYGANLVKEVYNFAQKAKVIASNEDFDVIHAHDWTTFPAAEEASKLTGKPFIVHVHITEFDKTGGQDINQNIYEIEKQGMLSAKKVIAVSNHVKKMLVKHYGIDPKKIEVVYNAKTELEGDPNKDYPKIKGDSKVVLFAGRVTMQKGPEYFVEMAEKVSKIHNNVIFVMIGTGDQLKGMIRKVAEKGLSDKFLFHGFYTRDEANKFFKLADLFVMPSVSEPFGVVPLEAMSRGTPVIISKQSGCSEILKNTLKVNFWDIDKMSNQVTALLNYTALNKTMSSEGQKEVDKLTWEEPARRCIDIYKELTEGKD